MAKKLKIETSFSMTRDENRPPTRRRWEFPKTDPDRFRNLEEHQNPNAHPHPHAHPQTQFNRNQMRKWMTLERSRCSEKDEASPVGEDDH